MMWMTKSKFCLTLRKLCDIVSAFYVQYSSINCIKDSLVKRDILFHNIYI